MRFIPWMNEVGRGGGDSSKVRRGMCRVLELVRSDMTPLGRAGLEVAVAYWDGKPVMGRDCAWYDKQIVAEFEAMEGGVPWYKTAKLSTPVGARRLAVRSVLAIRENFEDELRGFEYFDGLIDEMELAPADVDAALGDPRKVL